MSQSTFPKSWVLTNIDSVSLKCEQRTPKDDESFTYVDIGSVDRDLKTIAEPQYLFGKEAPSRARKVINFGDVLVSLTRPNLNAVAYVDKKYDDQIASTGFEVIKPLINSKYIFGLVRSRDFIESISEKVQGALYPAAKSSDVREFEFGLPPLAEQQQIAQKLDELLAQVDTLKTRLDAIPKILKRFRQSVLAAAVGGRLTEEWRGENKEILKDFESYELDENLPQSWRVVPLGDYVENWDNSRSPISSSERISRQGQYPYYGASGVIDSIDGYTHDGNFVLIGEDGANLVTRTKPIAFSAKGKVWVNNHAHVLRCKDGYENLYFEHYINSIDLTPWVSGSAQPKLNQKNMNQIPIPVPPKTEQTEIVRRVEQLFAYADQIEQRVKDAQARVNHLTQSILAKAFRGELTAEWRAQNPELISGENSAAALLERIKAEREENAKPKKKKA